jgi:hypothetical protein
MPLSDAVLSKINLDLLLARLTACAGKWFLQRGILHTDDILPATGESAKDLAYETVARFIEGEISYKPRSKKDINPEVFVLLKTVMWRDFLDILKEGREYDRTTVMDMTADGNRKRDRKTLATQTLNQFADESELHFEALNKQLILRRVKPCVSGERHLEEYVRAVVEYGLIKREDIAAFLKISPQEATNRQRSLRTKLASWARTVKSDGWKA